MRSRYWFILAGVAAVFALILGMTTAFSTGLSPRSYVDHTYARAAHLDPPGRDSRAYTSRNDPTRVAADISDNWRPQNRYADGSGIYLRYSDDAIVVKPRDGGSLIEVMTARRAYNHYPGVVAGFWGWGGAYGESFRGHGPGVGK